MKETFEEIVFKMKTKLVKYISNTPSRVTKEEIDNFDLDGEVALILAKKSKLSSNQRKNTLHIHTLLRMYKQHELKEKDKENATTND